MSEFASEYAYGNFVNHVVRKRRYVRDAATERFLAVILEQAGDRVLVMQASETLWRAQIGHGWRDVGEDDDPYRIHGPFEPGRMKPLTDGAKEGRANPKGIPHLYLATTLDTALGEVRPWVGSEVSVAQFKLASDLRLVDCTNHANRVMHWGFETPEDDWDTNVWCDVDWAFSQPISPSDVQADYVPTQIIAELFKSGGYDGVHFASSLGSGKNIVLFDLDAARLHGCALHQVNGITLESEQTVSPYVMQPRSGGAADG